ncbi:MAG: hypothetical protein ACXVCM_25390 [Ktedonobacteraceae bacterium]
MLVATGPVRGGIDWVGQGPPPPTFSHDASALLISTNRVATPQDLATDA